ncbi:MAG: MerR family transcriptional regulator [Actinocatenispora sp.]
MRIAQLSARTGVSVPTIKYYLREGLLPTGERTAPNQAEYSEEHLRRLRLIRALVDIGRLPIAAIRDVLTAVDAPDLAAHELLGTAQDALSPPQREDTTGHAAARDRVVALVAERDWHAGPGSPAFDDAASVLATLTELGQDDLIELVDRYADAAETLATHEVALVLARTDRERMVEGLVLGTILGERLFGAIRRLAHQDASARLLADAAVIDPT